MAEVQGKKKKKKSGAQRSRKERRFVGEQTYASRLAVGVGMLGAATLGAGVYARWITESPLAAAPYLIGIGTVVLGGSLVFGDLGSVPVRVGDIGVALERGNELERIVWCDLERVYAEGGRLFLKGKENSFSITIAAQPKAVARILAEGTRRVPEVMDVKREAVETLPSPQEGDSEVLTVEAVQVAGRSCAESGKTIAFERDARLCPQCCQVYLKDRVPKRCLTCKADLGDHATEV
jgi:hypothetical protein